jgi:hypothetical protein
VKKVRVSDTNPSRKTVLFGVDKRVGRVREFAAGKGHFVIIFKEKNKAAL